MDPHHKLLAILLHVFIGGHGDGHGLLVAVVVAGLGRAVVSWVQAVRLWLRDGEDSEDEFPFPSSDQVHHLLVRGSLDVYTIPAKEGTVGEREREGEQWDYQGTTSEPQPRVTEKIRSKL